ncbi:MAG: aminoglycoside phosphotransferase family protein [Gammaproteobacteria bacterium]|nr:aminoglycoside phosphotransferase family protein [Gammaproteobacteria bacterium]
MSTAAPVWEIARQFDFGAPLREVRTHGGGLINDTFLATLDTTPPRRAILQRINSKVFPQPQQIMQNLRVLLNHAQHSVSQSSASLQIPSLYLTFSNQDFVRDADGDYWRALQFITNTRALDRLANPTQARNVGRALGGFHTLLNALPVQQLHTTLPGFHIAPNYLAHFDAISTRAAVDADAATACEFVATHRGLAAVLEHGKHSGALPLRATHGDPKLDNFLFDAHSDRVVSLIDLDTVQPGLIHYDLGDCLRSCCNRSGESAHDPAATRFDLELCSAILHGYVDAARGFLTGPDFDFMYDAIRLLPFELGLRFLTDHLAGDVYFKTQTPGQNLQRARIQFQLTAHIESNEAAIRSLIAELR